MKSIAAHVVGILAVFSVGIVLACTAAQRRVTENLLTISASQCVAIAKARGRTDVAAYCGIAQDAIPVLEAALATPEGAVCTVPQDAGTQ